MAHKRDHRRQSPLHCSGISKAIQTLPRTVKRFRRSAQQLYAIGGGKEATLIHARDGENPLIICWERGRYRENGRRS